MRPGGSLLGNALPPLVTASLIEVVRPMARPDQTQPSRSPRPHAHDGHGCLAQVPLGGRRLETRYICWVIFRQRVAAGRSGVPHLKSLGSWLAVTKRHVQAHRARARLGFRCLTVRVGDRHVRCALKPSLAANAGALDHAGKRLRGDCRKSKPQERSRPPRSPLRRRLAQGGILCDCRRPRRWRRAPRGGGGW
jgi:hypothetical protein